MLYLLSSHIYNSSNDKIQETNTLEEKRWLLTKLQSLQLVNSLNFSFRPPTAICRTGGQEEDKWRTQLNCGLFSRKLTVGSAVVLQTDNCQPPTAIFAILLFPQECPLQETKTNWRRRGGCHQNCDMFSWQCPSGFLQTATANCYICDPHFPTSVSTSRAYLVVADKLEEKRRVPTKLWSVQFVATLLFSYRLTTAQCAVQAVLLYCLCTAQAADFLIEILCISSACRIEEILLLSSMVPAICPCAHVCHFCTCFSFEHNTEERKISKRYDEPKTSRPSAKVF